MGGDLDKVEALAPASPTWRLERRARGALAGWIAEVEGLGREALGSSCDEIAVGKLLAEMIAARTGEPPGTAFVRLCAEVRHILDKHADAHERIAMPLMGRVAKLEGKRLAAMLADVHLVPWRVGETTEGQARHGSESRRPVLYK